MDKKEEKMFDVLALTGYVLLIYVLVEKNSRDKLLYWLEALLIDRWIIMRVLTGLFVLFVFVSAFVDNIWNIIGMFLLIILLPTSLFTKEQLED